jgi:hypothetical protein
VCKKDISELITVVKNEAESIRNDDTVDIPVPETLVPVIAKSERVIEQLSKGITSGISNVWHAMTNEEDKPQPSLLNKTIV